MDPTIQHSSDPIPCAWWSNYNIFFDLSGIGMPLPACKRQPFLLTPNHHVMTHFATRITNLQLCLILITRKGDPNPDPTKVEELFASNLNVMYRQMMSGATKPISCLWRSKSWNGYNWDDATHWDSLLDRRPQST
jgi:hypothetical protein